MDAAKRCTTTRKVRTVRTHIKIKWIMIEWNNNEIILIWVYFEKNIPIKMLTIT